MQFISFNCCDIMAEDCFFMVSFNFPIYTIFLPIMLFVAYLQHTVFYIKLIIFLSLNGTQ